MNSRFRIIMYLPLNACSRHAWSVEQLYCLVQWANRMTRSSHSSWLTWDPSHPGSGLGFSWELLKWPVVIQHAASPPWTITSPQTIEEYDMAWLVSLVRFLRQIINNTLPYLCNASCMQLNPLRSLWISNTNRFHAHFLNYPRK